MTEQELINEAYTKALAACKRATKADKQFIQLQPSKGTYRLAAVSHNYLGETSYRFDMLPTEWAKNVVYRLNDVCLLPVDRSAIDEYFDKLKGR